MNRVSRSLMTALLAAAVAMTEAAPDTILPLVPAQAEIVISLNIRKLAGTPLFVKALDDKRCAGVKRKIGVFEGVTGISVLKDIERVTFFGLPDEKKHNAIALQGKLDTERVVKLLGGNASYEAKTIEGNTVHVWEDKSDDSRKYCVFLPGDVSILCNTEEDMKLVLAAKADPSKGLATSSNLFPKGHETATVWACMPKPSRPGKTSVPFDLLRMTALSGTVDIEADTLKLNATVGLESKEHAGNFKEAAEGALGLAKLQNKMPWMATLAEGGKVVAAEGQSSVVIEGTGNAEAIITLLAEQICRH